ncbi:hypothetical protein ACM0P6_01845 [Komagataeibacter sucrofermentans]|uniref:hypothetical protein n=1 Tax=Komagataeibacter sucrofermentans TaxID=1053551 RepID=UPI0011B80CF0|nr:hypothetical protein [Komagataeibacter sucrofermentans]
MIYSSSTIAVLSLSVPTIHSIDRAENRFVARNAFMIAEYFLQGFFRQDYKAERCLIFFTGENRLYGETGYNDTIKIGGFSANLFSNNTFSTHANIRNSGLKRLKGCSMFITQTRPIFLCPGPIM